MNSRTRLLLILAGLVCVALFISFLSLSAAKPPVALVRVVDTTGKPVPGAVLVPEGLRTKSDLSPPIGIRGAKNI